MLKVQLSSNPTENSLFHQGTSGLNFSNTHSAYLANVQRMPCTNVEAAKRKKRQNRYRDFCKVPYVFHQVYKVIGSSRSLARRITLERNVLVYFQ